MERVGQEEESQDLGIVDRLLRVFWAPGETFAAVRRRSSWLDWFLPVALLVAANMVALQLTLPVVQQAQQQVLEERLQEMPEAQRQQAMEIAQKTGRIGMVIGIPATTFALLFIVAGVLLLIARYGLGGQVNYAQMLAVWGYASLIGIVALLVRVPLMRAGNTAVVHTGLGVLLGEELLASFAGRFLSGIELFAAWQLGVAAIGLAVLTRSSTGKAFGWLFGLWLGWLMVRAGLGGLAAGMQAGG